MASLFYTSLAFRGEAPDDYLAQPNEGDHCRMLVPLMQRWLRERG